VRWDALFADLAAQAAALEQAELNGEIAERVRGEVGGLGLGDRARAAAGAELRLRLRGPLDLTGRLAGSGPDWLLLGEPDGREALVVLAQLVSVRGLPRYSAVPGSAGVVESRIGVRQLLRAIARDLRRGRDASSRRAAPPVRGSRRVDPADQRDRGGAPLSLIRRRPR
jgi:hypothetical protein